MPFALPSSSLFRWKRGASAPRISHNKKWALAPGLILLALAFVPLTIPNPTVHAAVTPTIEPHFNHPDQTCRTCHQQIYDAYQKTSMARGSGPAQQELGVPLLGERGFTHESSGITYRITLQQGQAVLTYDRFNPPLHGQHTLDYFIGSGKRGRTYLYQQEGLWFEVPINWYGKKELWDMAPAYENATAMPDPLPVDANCLHCHTGEVQPAIGGARNHFAAEPFRAAGVGCAACHGDPTAHLAGATLTHAGPILNPDKLTPIKRDSVCLQCHLEGDATVYLPNKSLATFQPGEDLSKSAIYFVDKTRAQQGGRASSQYEALLRSACMRAVGPAKLTCTTCHDPHSSPAPSERVAFYRAKCLTCHTTPAIATTHFPEQQDCAVCHMPTRKTLDISHEQLTDHDIEARPVVPTLTRHAQTPDLVPVGFAEAAPRETGLAYAQLAQRTAPPAQARAAGERALSLLQQAEQQGADDPELHNQLGYLLAISGNPKAAAAEYTATLRRQPQDPTATANLAVLDARAGDPTTALALLTRTVTEDPAQTPAALNLAFLQCRLGRKTEALETLHRALKFNPDSPAANAFLATGTYNTQTCPLH